MGPLVLVAMLVGLLALSATAVLAVTLALTLRRQRDLDTEVRRLREAVTRAQAALDQVGAASAAEPDEAEPERRPDYLITTVSAAPHRESPGRPTSPASPEPAGPPEPSSHTRVVLSEGLTEPLLKGAALAHGLRRALAAENRNRIRFHMRREVKRARRERRRADRAAVAADRHRRAAA